VFSFLGGMKVVVVVVVVVAVWKTSTWKNERIWFCVSFPQLRPSISFLYCGRTLPPRKEKTRPDGKVS